MAYRAAAGLARALPPSLVPPVEWAATRIAVTAMSGRRAQVERNLRRVYGADISDAALRGAVDETFGSYVRYWAESFRLPGTPPDVLDAGMRLEGFEQVDAAIAAGTGAILALPHLGGWEWAGFWVATVRNYPVSVVVEAVEPPELADWFGELRRSFGMEIIMLGPGAGSATAKALNENRVLCLLSDRDINGGGIPVEFFGEATTLPGGPATLALRSGAPLLPAAVYYQGGGLHEAQVLPALDTARQGSFRADVARVTQDLADGLEVLIRRAPEQWHLLQPNWPSDLVD
ncbi:MAG: phosphatidylinositol mannoside acyltransferase [Acidimicrobiales bacterium]